MTVQTTATETVNTATTTTYFFLITFQWPDAGGLRTVTLNGTFTAAAPVSRIETLDQIKAGARGKGVPDNANVLFLTIAPDQITPQEVTR